MPPLSGLLFPVLTSPFLFFLLLLPLPSPQSHAHLLESYEQETLRKKQEAMADFRAYGTGQGDDDDWAEEEKKEQVRAYKDI